MGYQRKLPQANELAELRVYVPGRVFYALRELCGHYGTSESTIITALIAWFAGVPHDQVVDVSDPKALRRLHPHLLAMLCRHMSRQEAAFEGGKGESPAPPRRTRRSRSSVPR